LWSIVARHLGPDVSDGEIARAWPAWFEANRAVVGDDPDLLRPGQVLRAPEGVRS
jgi:nucleoid-associated protein YgaU